ncbi:MAG: Ig-like domain-containing protein, partial [Thermoanaerobaculia bacterium]
TTNTDVPVAGAPAYIRGPGTFAYTDSNGVYRIEGVPVQGDREPAYAVVAIDMARKLQGSVDLAPLLDVSDAAPVAAPDILLAAMTGGIDGIVLDPLGRPLGNVDLSLGYVANGISRGDGRFSFENVAIGSSTVTAHVGDGLTSGKIGYFGTATTNIIFGGHRPFITIRLVGAGVVKIWTKSNSATGILTPIQYRPTIYSEAVRGIGIKLNAIQSTTDTDGRLELILPVGGFTFTASNPFHGSKVFEGTLDYPGQIRNYEITFDDASTVTGQVVDVDGITPVPNGSVVLSANGFLPQSLQTDAQGNFTFELVPQGNVTVTTSGSLGSVDRVGIASGSITGPGQTLDLVVRMRAQGTVRGVVHEQTQSGLTPMANAEFYVQESGYPTRRLPAGNGFYRTSAAGAYEVSHLFAGPITVIARDPLQVSRQGRAVAEIASDWQVVSMPNIVMSTSVGSLSVVVRDSGTGAPVSDCQITLSIGEMSVADGDGRATFDALALGAYTVYAFHAPTGRGGQIGGTLQSAGQRLELAITLDQRGRIGGTLWDDAGKTSPVGGGTIRLDGTVNGRQWGTSFSALATTSTSLASVGTFQFDGMPVGHYSLRAGVGTSPRQAAASTDITPTSPISLLDLVLESVGSRYARIFENFRALPHLREVNPAGGVFSVQLISGGSYDFTLLQPTAPYPGHLYDFSSVLTNRAFSVIARESSGEQRSVGISSTTAPNAGTQSDPYQLVLTPKGVVRIFVKDAIGTPVANAAVSLTSSGGGAFPSSTDAAGSVVLYAVPAGTLSATAKSGTRGGRATGTLTYDDDVIDLNVVLEPAVSAHGTIYLPVANDAYNGQVSTLVPAPGAIAEIIDSKGAHQVILTDADGKYSFLVLPVGSYTLMASSVDGQSVAQVSGSLVGPDGHDNLIPLLILDGSTPRLLSITPPPGQEGVSRGAAVEITLSEPLMVDVLPSGASAAYFKVLSATGSVPAGVWSSSVDPDRKQIVRFVPSVPYENQTIHSITIIGGPGGVRDLAGRALTASGNIGSNFTTSDTVGPKVVATVPSLDRPVDPRADIRFDFSEKLTGTDAELDGDGVNDAAELFWGQNAGGGVTWRPLLITMFLTRGNYSLVVQQPQGLTLADDSGQRRIQISRLRDASGNPMPLYSKDYAIYDANAPHIEVSFPAGASDGVLSGGVAYTLTPVLSSLDGSSVANPGGDIDHIDYFLASSSDPSVPNTLPAFTARTYPYSFGFAAAYTGNGVDARLFPVWVEATDTSTNKSNRVPLPMRVLPNVAPAIASVDLVALAPVAGTFYAGSNLRGTVQGLGDIDSIQLTVNSELRRENTSNPSDPADLMSGVPGVLYSRPAGGWPSLVAPSFTYTLPISRPEGSRFFLRVKATDPQGASVTKESAVFAVADDAANAVIDRVVAHLSSSSTPATVFNIGQRFVIDVQAHDGETAVKAVSVAFDGVFTSPLVASLVGGAGNLYRTAELSVPPGIPQEGTSVTATVTVADEGGNAAVSPLSFRVEPTRDPTAPTAKWISPWQAALWPAGYTSVASTQGVPLLLRVAVSDRDVDGSGNDIPGSIVAVELRGPADASGRLATMWVPAILVSGTQSAGAGTYQLLWRVPNGVAEGASLNFEVRVSDNGGHQIVEAIQVTAAAPRRVYERVTTAVIESDSMLAPGAAPAGPVFLLDGSVLSLYSQPDGAPLRKFNKLYLFAGGDVDGSGNLIVKPTILTAPEITSLASAIAYRPLELEIAEYLGVASGASLDVSGKGLMGSDGIQSSVLPGEFGSQPRAAGSHGGFGSFGNIGNIVSNQTVWDQQPGSTYDSVRDPKLPGSGGGATDASGLAHGAAQNGGGVVRVIAPTATIRLHGELLADSGVGGAIAGAGGAIRVLG